MITCPIKYDRILHAIYQATSDAIELDVPWSRETATSLGACPIRPASMRTKPRALHLDGDAREEQATKVVAALTGVDVMKVPRIDESMSFFQPCIEIRTLRDTVFWSFQLVS